MHATICSMVRQGADKLLAWQAKRRLITSRGTPTLEAGHPVPLTGMTRCCCVNLLPRCTASRCNIDMQQAGNHGTNARRVELTT
jgi:hypothetical protein